MGDMDALEEVTGVHVPLDDVAVIKTHRGRDVEKRCLHMMGGRFCLCQFLQWIDSPQYHCRPQQPFDMLPRKDDDKGYAAAGLDIEDYVELYYDADSEEDSADDGVGE